MANFFSKDNIPILGPTYRLQWEAVQNCYVVLYPEGMVKLSESAGEIMKRCTGEKDISNIIADLQQHFQTATISNDVLDFLEAAHNNGWINKK